MYAALAIVFAAILFVLLRARGGAPQEQLSAANDDSRKLHWLVAEGADPMVGTWHLGTRRVTAGRAPSNYIQLAIPGMSRQHCAFYADGELLTLVDMSSSNGTRVNGRPIQTARLFDGDIVELAGARFVYRLHGEFGMNAAWASKQVGREVHNTTAMPESLLQLRAQATFRLTGGDAAETASQIGISVARLEELLRAG